MTSVLSNLAEPGRHTEGSMMVGKAGSHSLASSSLPSPFKNGRLKEKKTAK
jgi:hypothetical protein